MTLDRSRLQLEWIINFLNTKVSIFNVGTVPVPTSLKRWPTCLYNIRNKLSTCMTLQDPRHLRSKTFPKVHSLWRMFIRAVLYPMVTCRWMLTTGIQWMRCWTLLLKGMSSGSGGGPKRIGKNVVCVVKIKFDLKFYDTLF